MTALALTELYFIFLGLDAALKKLNSRESKNATGNSTRR